LPDGYQKFPIGYILDDLGMENVIYSGHLEYFTTFYFIIFILTAFGHFVVIWYIFRFGILYQAKSGNPA
jgi:hypothetical protein